MMTRELCSRCDLVFSLGSLKLWLTAPLLGLLISVSAIGADRSVPAGLEALKKLDGRLAKIASKNLAVLKLPTQDE